MNILTKSIGTLLCSAPRRLCGRKSICLANEAGSAADNKSITLFLPNQLTAPEAGTEHWVQLSPFGDFGNRTGSARVIQRFRKEDAENICNAFNSPVRRFTQPFGMPFYIGHPDHPRFKGQPGHTDTASKGRGKEMVVRHDAACADCQAFANAKPDASGAGDAAPCQKHGLFVKVDWNEDGQHLLANQSFHGHSVNWSAIPDGRENGVQIYRPVKVKSTGFTNEPNIPVAPASLANAAASDDEETPAQVIVPPKLKLIAGFKEDQDVTMEQIIEALEKARPISSETANAEADESAALKEQAQEALGFFAWLKKELAKGYEELPDCIRYAVNSLLEFQENQGKLKALMGETLGNVTGPLQTRAEGLCAALGELLLSNADATMADDADKKSFVDQIHALLGSDPASGKAGVMATLQDKVKKAGLIEGVKKAKAAAQTAYEKHDKARKDLEDHLSNERKAHATLAVDALVKAGKVVTKDRDSRIEQLCNAGADQFDAKLAEFANGTMVVKTEAKSVGLSNAGAKLARGEQERRIRMEELMQQRERQFPNETYQERWNEVVTSAEGQGLLDQMNAAKSVPAAD